MPWPPWEIVLSLQAEKLIFIILFQGMAMLLKKLRLEILVDARLL